MPSIKLINVTKRFGKITAINRVTLNVKDGEYLCVLGPTGSGKTTLLRLIAGLIKPDEGEIYIGEELVNDVPPQERNTVYVPQDYALFPHMEVIENVAFGPLSRGISKEEAFKTSLNMLKMIRLDWRAHSFPGELSGGMQQRVALARGLASGAEILLLDEPLGALDARLRVELREKLRAMVKDYGLTAIHVTHDQEEALMMADRIVVLREGVLQQQGTPYHVYRRPTNIFVANFIGHTNFLEGVVTKVDMEGSSVKLRGRIRIRSGDSDYMPGESVVTAIREEKVNVSKEKREDVNSIEGTVISKRFLGAFVLYEVRLLNGDHIRSRLLISEDDRFFSIGDDVYVNFAPKDVMLYQYPPLGLYKELEVI